MAHSCFPLPLVIEPFQRLPLALANEDADTIPGSMHLQVLQAIQDSVHRILAPFHLLKPGNQRLVALFDSLDSLANQCERLLQSAHLGCSISKALVSGLLQRMQGLQQRLSHISPYRCSQSPLTLLHLGC